MESIQIRFEVPNSIAYTSINKLIFQADLK